MHTNTGTRRTNWKERFLICRDNKKSNLDFQDKYWNKKPQKLDFNQVLGRFPQDLVNSKWFLKSNKKHKLFFVFENQGTPNSDSQFKTAIRIRVIRIHIWTAWRILFTFPPTISNQSNKGIVTSLLETRNWEKVGRDWIKNLTYATIFKTNRLREKLSQLQFSTSDNTDICHRDSRKGEEFSVSIFMPIELHWPESDKM